MSYSSPAGLRDKWPKLTSDVLSDAQLQMYLDEAYDDINSQLASRYPVPIANPGPALVQAENDLAYEKICLRPHIGPRIDLDASVAFNVGRTARARVAEWAEGQRPLLNAAGQVVQPSNAQQPIGSTTAGKDPVFTLESQVW